MSIGAALYTYLSGQSTLTDLVSTRIYPGLAPQDATYPYIVWSQTAQQETYHVAGNSALVRVSLQFDTWDDDPVTVDSVANVLRGLLDSYSGAWGSVKVRNAQLENMINLSGATSPGEEFGPFRVTQDWDVWYTRS